MKNVPHNSHLQFDFLLPFIRIEDFEPGWAVLDNWTLSGYATYVLLQKNTSLQELNRKIKDYIPKHSAKSKDFLYLQRLKDIHLYSSHIQFGIEGQGNIKYVYIFSVVALFVLIIACINFMNLATARSSNRAKEVGLRKVVGARRPQLMGQFFFESVLMALLSLILAVVLVELFLPAFRNLSGKPLHPVFSSNISILLAIIVMTLITGFISGTYPALFLSSLRPAKVLKGRLRTEGRGYLFRKILVVSQFSLSILLIICTVLVSSQVDYMRNRKLGLEKEQMVYLPMRSELVDRYDPLKIELLKSAAIRNVAASSNIPTYGVILTVDYITWEGKNPEDIKVLHVTSTGYDFIETLNMEMIEGRSISEEYPSDENAVVINETAQKIIGMEDPIGKLLMLGDTELQIIGIVKDYHFRSLHSEIGPLLLLNDPSLYRYILIKLDSEDIPGTLASIESTWKTFCPDTPFEYHFLDEAYDKLYRTEQRMGTLFNYSTGLAILISCLGLFGLASFMAEKRTKEIGIRKILGASVSGVVILLNREFIKWILIANIIAWPVAYYAMSKWLQGFAYRTNMGIWIFALAALAAFTIAVLTVSFQSIKAATANPADSLRYE